MEAVPAHVDCGDAGSMVAPPPVAAAATRDTAPTQKTCVRTMGGTLIAPYQMTTKHDGTNQYFYQAITAMPQYEDKSFEELRLDDYLAENKGMKCEDKKSQKMVIVIDRDELTGAPVFSRRPRRETDDRPRTEDYYPSEKRPIYGYQNPNEKPNKFRSSSNSNNNNNNTEEEAAAAAPLKTTPSEVICKKTKVKRKSRRSGHLPAWEIQYKLALTHGLSTCAGRKAARAALKALGVVSLPAKGKKYNLEEALDQILKFPYNSSERGAVIKLLCEGGYAGIKKSQLYKCMKRANEKLKNQTAIQQKV